MRSTLRLVAVSLAAAASGLLLISAYTVVSRSADSAAEPPAEGQQTDSPTTAMKQETHVGMTEAGADDCAGIQAPLATTDDSVAKRFHATFTANPASPLSPCDLQHFDVQVHSRDTDRLFQLEPMNAQHGADCSAPPASHVTDTYAGSVFVCRDHLMTSINGSGYAVIYLTPDRLLNFASGGSLTFDLSTERMSTRDWWDILLTPFTDNLALPLLSDLSQGVDLQGAPVNAISVATDNGEGAPVLKLVRDGVEEDFPEINTAAANAGVADGTNQAAVRQSFRLTIADGRIRFERLASPTAPALLFWDIATTVPFSSAIVQFGHHSYNPTKDDAGEPGTWHWDNLTLEPAVPFTMIKADRRYTEGGDVAFDAPAPAHGYLRFSALCRVSIDGQLVNRAPSFDRGDSGYHPEHASSYFVPIPGGQTSFEFSFAADDWYEGPCIAQDFSIWAPPD